MYCPNCGGKTSTEQKFCRACGLGLDKIALSLCEQFPNHKDLSLRERQERLEKWGVAALSVFGTGLGGFFLYAIIQKLLASGISLFGILAVLGLVIVMASGLLSVILFARARELGEQANKRQLQPSPTEPVHSTRDLLTEPRLEPVPTITDRTTELLFDKRKSSD